MKKLIFYSIIVLAAFSCRKDLDLKGIITGKVELYGPSDSNKYLENVNIVLENNHFRKETFANESGIYSFLDVEEGNYTLTFSCEGYETCRLTNYTFIGLGKMAVIERTYLNAISAMKVLGVDLSLTSGINGYTVVEGMIATNGESFRGRIYLFFDRSPEVSDENYMYHTLGGVNFTADNLNNLMIKDFIHDLPKGEDWYVGIYLWEGPDYPPYTEPRKIFQTIMVTVD
ncbi:MAG: carboxypeptidase-like regulatory domain-containing protein [Mangrovibacterium sp.]